jgi:hypothetical protein
MLPSVIGGPGPLLGPINRIAVAREIRMPPAEPTKRERPRQHAAMKDLAR